MRQLDPARLPSASLHNSAYFWYLGNDLNSAQPLLSKGKQLLCADVQPLANWQVGTIAFPRGRKRRSFSCLTATPGVHI